MVFYKYFVISEKSQTMMSTEDKKLLSLALLSKYFLFLLATDPSITKRPKTLLNKASILRSFVFIILLSFSIFPLAFVIAEPSTL